MSDNSSELSLRFIGLIEAHVSEGWREQIHGDIARYTMRNSGIFPIDEVSLIRSDEGVDDEANVLQVPNDKIGYAIDLSFRGDEFASVLYMDRNFCVYKADNETLVGSKAEAFAIHVLENVRESFIRGDLSLQPKPN